MSIYDRQESIKITNLDKPIAIVGVGGIGFHVAKLLAMSGVQTLYLFDPDTVEESNLNRLDIPLSWIGKNKAMVVRSLINVLRPETKVVAFPFIMQDITLPVDTAYIVDCTDKMTCQTLHQSIARSRNITYVKAGYDGTHMTIANELAEWGEGQDGYTITPSWIVPSIVVAALTVAKILKYGGQVEMSADLKDLYVSK